jgi:hypothetical protein
MWPPASTSIEKNSRFFQDAVNGRWWRQSTQCGTTAGASASRLTSEHEVRSAASFIQSKREGPIMTFNNGVQLTILFLTAVLSSPAPALAAPDAAHQVPFKGSFNTVETIVVEFPTLFTNGIGGGQAAHLGRYTVTYQAVVDLFTGQAVGSADFIAANGDSLFTEFVGQSSPTADPDISSIEETYTITGGTGRFASATGSFSMERVINLVTGVTSGSFDGDIAIQH